MTAHSFLVKKKIVLYAGTFERYQGIDLLIASAEQVLRRHGDVLFLLVGGTPDQVRHYEDRVKQVGLSAHFHFTGTRPPEQIPDFCEALPGSCFAKNNRDKHPAEDLFVPGIRQAYCRDQTPDSYTSPKL